jgi:hypothetical protein
MIALKFNLVLSKYIPILKHVLFVYIVLCAHSLAQAQETRGRFFMEVGATARTTIFYRHDAERYTSLLHPNAPYDYRAGVNGMGIQVTPGIALTKSVRLHAGTTLRYDVYRINTDDSRDHTFYVDESVFVTKTFGDIVYIGGGYTFYNLGKSLHYDNNGTEETLGLQFNSFDIVSGVCFRRVWIEPRVSVVRKDFPGSIKERATLLGVRVFYVLKC